MFVLMAFFAMATATVPLEASEEMDEEVGRFFLVSNSGGTYLGLNSTLLWTAVLGAGVIIAVFALLSSGALPLAAQNYKRYGQQFLHDKFYEEPTESQTRYKRFVANGNVKTLYLLKILNLHSSRKFLRQFNLRYCSNRNIL